MVRSRTATRRVVVALAALSLLAAACGDDDDDDGAANTAEPAGTAAPGTAAPGTAAPADTEPSDTEPPDTEPADTEPADTTAPVDTGSAGSDDPETTAEGGAGCGGEVDTSLDEDLGEGAGEMAMWLECGETQPLKAEGEPIKIGFMNHEGDPAASFPEYREAAEAAVGLINNELGGVGGDLAAGVPGRPIELMSCGAGVNPGDVVSCANEVAAAKPLATFVATNFFGLGYDVLQASGTAVFVGTPVTLADSTTEGVWALAAAGGCLGELTGLVEFTVNHLEARRVMIPWNETPPGVVCFHDQQSKPLDVLKGDDVPGAPDVETIEGLEYDNVPIPPATPDMTAPATKILDFDPDAVMWAAPSADCWSLVNSMAALGFDPSETPLVLSTSCLDIPLIEAAGDVAEEVYYVGGFILNQPDIYEGLIRREMETYIEKLAQYSPGTQLAGLGAQGFQGTMLLWHLLQDYVADAGGIESVTSAGFSDFVAATSNHHHFAALPMGCADAIEPYVGVCNRLVSAVQYTEGRFDIVEERVDGTYLMEGTEIRTGE